MNRSFTGKQKRIWNTYLGRVKGWATTFMFDLFLNDIKMVAKWGLAFETELLAPLTPKPVVSFRCIYLQSTSASSDHLFRACTKNYIFINPLAIMSFTASGSDFHTSSAKKTKVVNTIKSVCKPYSKNKQKYKLVVYHIWCL